MKYKIDAFGLYTASNLSIHPMCPIEEYAIITRSRD